jgi:hypothetical protein
MREEAAKHGRKADAIELSCMGRASVDSIKKFEDIGISRVIVAPPGFDKENLTRGLDQLGNDIIAKL